MRLGLARISMAQALPSDRKSERGVENQAPCFLFVSSNSHANLGIYPYRTGLETVKDLSFKSCVFRFFAF